MPSLQDKATAQAANTKSHYRGVRKRSEDRFAAEIRDPSKKRRIWLGTFSSDIDAAHAYDRAARAIKGSRAKTNFPLSASLNPTPVQRSATKQSRYKDNFPNLYQNLMPAHIQGILNGESAPKKPAQKDHVPSWMSSNMFAKAATRPWTHAYLSKTSNVGSTTSSSSSSLLEVMFPPELQRQQQLAALKMSNQAREKENEDDGRIRLLSSHSPCNSSDPSSSAVTESRDSPSLADFDLNLPAPVDEEDECGHLDSDEHCCRTLLLFK